MPCRRSDELVLVEAHPTRLLSVITNWHEIEGSHRERGHIAATWQDLTGANSVTAGVQRISVDPGKWATPLHLEGSEEEIFYVLSGSGVSLQWDGEKEEAFAIGAGDCLAHLACEYAHTSVPGTTASSCSRSVSATIRRTRSCRAPASRGSGRRGFSRERPRIIPGRVRQRSALPPGRCSPSARRASSTSTMFLREQRGTAGGTVASAVRGLGTATGSERVGLSHYVVQPGNADEPTARALRRGGDLRRSRGQRDRARCIRARAMTARSRSSRWRPGARSPVRLGRSARTRSGRVPTG